MKEEKFNRFQVFSLHVGLVFFIVLTWLSAMHWIPKIIFSLIFLAMFFVVMAIGSAAEYPDDMPVSREEEVQDGLLRGGDI